jgi:hypothetical protein
MLIAVTLSLLLITALSLILLRIFRPDFSFAWPLAAVGTFAAWISVFLWQINLPIKLTLFTYSFKSVVDYSLVLIADGVNFPYAIGIASLVMAAILISTLKAGSINPLGWVNILLFAILGLVAVLADNPLTLVVAWALIDITALVGSLSMADDAHKSENVVWSYSARVVGLGLVLWAEILSSNKGLPVNFSSIQQNIGYIFLIAVIIRIGALLIDQPHKEINAIRNPQNATITLVSAAANLVLLSHVNIEEGDFLLIILFSIFIGVIGFFSVINWLRSPDNITSPSFWMIGLAALAMTATLQGNPIGAAAWGSASLFVGGILFFYSTRRKWLTIVLLASAFSISSLPYSLTATGWDSGLPNSWISLLLFLPLQSLIIASYIRSVALGTGGNLNDQPNWVKVFYPMGLMALVLTSIILGFRGWVGSGQIGAWIPALIVVVITAALSLILMRIPLTEPLDTRHIPRPTAWVESVTTLGWGLFRATRRLTELFSATFEGDGGFLWTILLLVLFVSILSGYVH